MLNRAFESHSRSGPLGTRFANLLFSMSEAAGKTLALSNVLNVTDRNYVIEVLCAEVPVVLEVWAPWCPEI